MKIWIIGIVVGLVALVLGMGACSASYINDETRMRNLINAKQKDNTSEYDAMWKKISQVAQVSEKDRESLKTLFVEHAQARTSGGSKDGSLMKWVTESVPNVNNDIMKSLVNTITASRDSWTMRQKELLDLSRKHNDLIGTVPGKWIISMFGNATPIDIQIVTSTRSTEAFATGKDDDVNIFSGK